MNDLETQIGSAGIAAPEAHQISEDSLRGSAYHHPKADYIAELTLVSRGRPMGELMRRYWHPIYKSEKLRDLPVQVRLLCEDIILFRMPGGTVGAVYPRCMHRGSSLLYGKVTDKGLRCAYHGWTFDTEGRCTEQPCEVNGGGARRNALRQPWYFAAERYGFVWVYMGPPDKKPALPRYDILENLPMGWEIYADDTTRPSAGAGYMPCNWLQHHENAIDPAHVAIVHAQQFPPMMAQAESTYTFEKRADRVTGRGLSKMGSALMDFRVEIPLPNVRIIPNPLLDNMRPDGKADSVAWTVPKDDTDTIVFTAITQPTGSPNDPDPELYNGKAWRDMSVEEHQRFPGDFETQVSQGPITAHSEEHLTASDRGVVYLRRLLQDALKDVAEGRDPPLAFGASDIYIETTSGITMSENLDYAAFESVGESVSEAGTRTPVASTEAVTLAGHWNLTMKSPLGDKKAALIVVQSGSRLTGRMIGEEGETPISDAKLIGSVLSWNTRVTKPMSMALKFSVRVDGDSLTGTFKPGMFPASSVSGSRDRSSSPN